MCDLSIDLNLLYKMAFSDNIVAKNPAARAYIRYPKAINFTFPDMIWKWYTFSLFESGGVSEVREAMWGWCGVCRMRQSAPALPE